MYLINHKDGLIHKKQAQLDHWKVKGSYLTQRLCTTCNEWRDVNEYPTKKMHGVRVMVTQCKHCHRDYVREYGTLRRRRAGIPPFIYLEDRLIYKDDIRGLICTHCHEWKPLIDYGPKIIESRYGVAKITSKRICNVCRTHQTDRRRLLRRLREVFGENSREYRFAENEKRHHHFKALCKMWGLLSDSGIRFKGKWPVSGVLPGMPVGEVSFEEAWEETAARLAEDEARRRSAQA